MFGSPTIALPLAIKKCTVQTGCTVYIYIYIYIYTDRPDYTRKWFPLLGELAPLAKNVVFS